MVGSTRPRLLRGGQSIRDIANIGNSCVFILGSLANGILPRNTRAANLYSFTRERYHNNKYKNSPFYKGAMLWDQLPVNARQCLLHTEFKKVLTHVYREYNVIIYNIQEAELNVCMCYVSVGLIFAYAITEINNFSLLQFIIILYAC